MNDNRHQNAHDRRPRFLLIEGGTAPDLRRCFCGAHPTTETACDFTARRLLYALCETCGAEGPRERTYDLAVLAWNRIVIPPLDPTP